MTTVRRTNHWRGIVALALLLGAVGVITKRPLVLLSACVAVGYAVYPRLSGPPTTAVAIDRRLEPADPAPGDPVTVTVTVTNEGSETLRDVRVVDGVPAMLTVTDGTARSAAVLGSGEAATFAYTVEAAPGTHRFRPATVIAVDRTGAHEVETTVEADVSEITCRSSLSSPPIDRGTEPYPGRILTDRSGDGIEFSRMREYRPGDGQNRIDWNRLARTGSLSTIEFRREQTVSVVVCVDARAVAYVGQPEEPHAVSYSVAAAREMLESIWDLDERAGLTVLGREWCWIPPSRGRKHEAATRRRLRSHPAFSPQPPTGDEGGDARTQMDDISARLGPNTQVVLLSPLADDDIVDFCRELVARGHETTVVSPDVTTANDVGDSFAGLERQNRLHRLRRGDVRVLDWDPETALASAVSTAERRWSR